jgi:chromosome segregation ATPase
VLKDCEAALEMANNETDKANKVARDAKAKVVELDARVYQIEGELKDALDRAAGLESELKTYRAKYADAKSTLGEKDSVIGGKEDKISGLSDKVWNSVPLKLRL